MNYLVYRRLQSFDSLPGFSHIKMVTNLQQALIRLHNIQIEPVRGQSATSQITVEITMESLQQQVQQQVATLLEQEPTLLTAAMAERLNVSEFDVVNALPTEMVAVVDGSEAETLLSDIADWGTVTTIVHSFGSIFEVKAPLPKGKMARGYYNLMGRDGQLHGHLKLDTITHVALVSKPFMGRESHYFGFFSAQGDNIFKVYLGRDEKRELLSDQVTRFKALQQQLQK